MAKKFVRGITDIKNIEKQDFDTNNVNDLLSDGEHTYVHRKKKDKTEEYHCLTDNIKKIEKVDNGLLTVTNYNKTKNSATLQVHHDYYKSQRLSSPAGTINVNNGENGTTETTTVDVNPDKIRSICKPTVEEYEPISGTGGYMKTMKTYYGDGTLEYKFFVQIDKGVTNLEFRMTQTDLDYLYYVSQKYGQEGRINIQGSSIQIYQNPTKIYFASNGSTFNPHFVVFFDILPVDPTVPTQHQAPRASVDVEKVETLEKGKVETLETGKLEL